MPSFYGDGTGMSSLTVRGLGMLVFSLVCTVTLPIVEHFLFYNTNPDYVYIPIVTACLAGVIGLTGLAAVAKKNGTYLALHAVLAVCGAALSGWFNTQFYFDLRDKCGLQQLSFKGCSECACAAAHTCIQADFNAGGACGQCDAVGTDLCAEVSKISILTLMGAIQVRLLCQASGI